MFRRYNRQHSRFDQPDPWDGSYDLSDPQSFNRYSYVRGDPVNLVDPSGLCGFTIFWARWSDGSITYTSRWNGPCEVSTSASGSGTGTMEGMITAGGFGRADGRPITEGEARGNIGGRDNQPPDTPQPLGPTVSTLWKAAYDSCLRTRRSYRDGERKNRWAEVGWNSAKDGLYAGGVGFAFGVAVGKTKIGDYLPGVAGKVVGRVGAPAAGAALGFTSGMVSSLMKNVAESTATFERRMRNHENDDASECIKAANETVSSISPRH